MPVRKNPPLACGEYVAKDASLAVLNARLRLLQAIKEIHAAMLKGLADEVFPTWSPTVDRLAELLSTKTPYRRLSLDEGQLKCALDDWAAKFNVTCDWLLDEAVRALCDWKNSAESLKALQWNPIPVFHRAVVNAPDVEIRIEGWEMELSTWFDYRRFVHEEVDKKLCEYESKARELATSTGLVPAPRTYSAANLEWFVLYQFAGLSSNRIVKRMVQKNQRCDDSTVLKGIKAAKKLIAWGDPRKPGPTRNRKIR